MGEAEGWGDEEAFLPVMVFQSDMLMLCAPMDRGKVENDRRIEYTAPEIIR